MRLLVVLLISYLLNSIRYIFGAQSEMMQVAANVLLAFFQLYVLSAVTLNVIANVRALKTEAAFIVSEDMRDIKRGMLTKVVIFIILGVIIDLYCLFQVFDYGLVPFLNLTGLAQEQLHGISVFICWSVLTLIMILFHPCWFTAPFRLGMIGNLPVDGSSDCVGPGRRRRKTAAGREVHQRPH